MEASVERTQRTFIKLILGIIFGLFLFIFLCWGGCRLYGTMESRHLARRAAAYMGGGDLRQAALSARRALQLDPKGTDAMKVLAEVAERSGEKSAVEWRRKILELEPTSTEAVLALSNSAVQFADLTTAEKALARLDENARQTAEFHVAAARLADGKRQIGEAEIHWAKAVELSPENKSYQLQYNVELLRTDDPSKRSAALEKLDQLRGDEKQRAPATRAIIVYGAGHRVDGQKLATLARELQDYPEATFSDHMLYLDILRQTRDPSFAEYLTTVEKDATTKSNNLATLLAWMKTSGMSLLAIDFSKTLSSEIMSKWPMPLIIAECYAKLADWADLEAWVKDKNWSDFDFLRHAYLALAFRNSDNSAGADREWAAAKKAASGEPRSLSSLARTIIEWRWTDEAVDLLWALSKDPAEQSQALRGLYEHYIEVKDTPGLYRVLLRLVEVMPNDVALQNNLAQIAMLLDVDTERAQQLASDVYQKEPGNPAYVSTYAFALYKKGDVSGAVRTLESLKEEQLREPAVAAYYGIILTASGQKEKGREFLTLGNSAKELLPEEKVLLTKAEGSLP